MSNRAVRRRMERALAKVKPNPGRGKGWRLSVHGNRYPVRELAGPFDVEAAEAESDRIRRRFGIE